MKRKPAQGTSWRINREGIGKRCNYAVLGGHYRTGNGSQLIIRQNTTNHFGRWRNTGGTNTGHFSLPKECSTVRDVPFTFLTVVKFNNFNATTYNNVAQSDGAVIYSQRGAEVNPSPGLAVSSSINISAGGVKRLCCTLDNTFTIIGRKGNTEIVTNRWYTLAGKYLPSEGMPNGFHVYVDGVLDDESTVTLGSSASFAGGYEVDFGRHETWPTDGHSDDADIEIEGFFKFDVALSDDEIAALSQDPFSLVTNSVEILPAAALEAGGGGGNPYYYYAQQ